jgi:hypothetical protein
MAAFPARPAVAFAALLAGVLIGLKMAVHMNRPIFMFNQK